MVLSRWLSVKNLHARSFDWEDLLKEEMTNRFQHSCLKIPWTEEPGGLQSIGSQRVGHDLATAHTHTQVMLFDIVIGNHRIWLRFLVATSETFQLRKLRIK